MSTSTNGHICWGILFEEGTEFPWADDSEAWWRNLNGYAPPFEIWGETEILPGVTDEMKRDYYSHRREWLEANPLPFEMVNTCHIDHPIWILAVPETYIRCWRGSAVAFRPSDLVVSDRGKERFMEFISKHIDLSEAEDPEPKWYLSSYWG